ncbi:MAG: MFS transporter [Bacteroidota bacterium]
MNQQKTRYALIIVSVILVMIVTVFTVGLNSSSFKKSYINSLVASFSVVATQYVDKIEYALKYGKPLANFHGLVEMLQEAKEQSEGVDNIRIIGEDGVILYDLSQNEVGRRLPQPLLLHNDFRDGKEEGTRSYFLFENEYHVLIPIYDRQDSWAGSMEMIFKESMVNTHTNRFLHRIIWYSLLLCLFSMVILIFLIIKLPIVTKNGDVNRKLVLVTIAIILSLVQIAFGLINYGIFKKVYTDIAKGNTRKTAVLIQKEINQVINKGLVYQDLTDIQVWLRGFLKAIPEIERIEITDQNNKVLYSTDTQVQTAPVSPELQMEHPLRPDHEQTSAILRTTFSKKHIEQKLLNIALDMMTVLVTSFIFMIEVLLFLAVVLKKGMKDKTVQEQAVKKEGTDVDLVRPLGFIIFFSAFMSMTFIPVLMKELYRPLWGLSENVIFGLPISVELFCGAMAALLAGYLMGRTGWKPIFFIGLFFFGCGAFLSGMARDAVAFIIARGVFGVGYGFCLLSMQGYANSATDFVAKNKGISVLTAGSYAGINCGCVLGAMLAERIGFSKVFYVTFSTSVLAGVYVLLYMKNSVVPKTRSKLGKKGRLGQFFGDRKLWSFLVFIVIPAAISGMFLEYFLPLYSKAVGVSAADVGRVFLLNGLAVVYMGPVISKFIGKYFGFKIPLVIFASIIATAMLLFARLNSIQAACLSAVLLGVAVGFGDAVQNNYLLSLETTANLGEGIAIGFLNVTTKIGQTLGPLIFGLLMVLGPSLSVGLIGWSVIGSLALFVILSSSGNRNGINN